jgi:hypothetical protein
MTTSQANVNILVVVEPTATATESSLRITFASGYTVAAGAGAITVSTASLPATVQGETLVAWPSITAGTATGQVVDFPSGNITPGTLYGFYITAGITTPSSTGQYINTITTRDGSDVDTAQIATRIITNDQVVITATVPPTFSFVLGTNTTTFPTDLDPSAPTSATGVTVTVGTNASNGWIAWLRSANTSLDSASKSEAIETVISGSCTNVSGAGDFYQLDVNLTSAGTGSGSITIPAGYNCTNGTHGGTFYSTFTEIATSDGTADSQIITLVAIAKPSAIRAAATDYTDTWTVVGAANF